MRHLFIILFIFLLSCLFLLPTHASPRTDCGKVVEPGQRIQDAINNPPVNKIICVKPGVYKELIDIKHPGLTVTAHDPTNRPIIDGDTNPSNGEHNYEIPTSGQENPLKGGRVYNYNQQVLISNKDITFSHFIVRNSRGDNIQIWSKSNPVTGIKIHNILAQNAMVTNINVYGANNGVGTPGNGSHHNSGTVISDNIFEYASLYNLYCDPNDYNGFCNWPGNACLKGVEGVNFKNNIIRYSKGDGLLLDCNWGKSNNNIIDGNIIYDTAVSSLYVHASSDSIVRNNIVFTTPSNPFRSSPNWVGIIIEGQENESHRRSGNYGVSNIKIYNNITWGMTRGLILTTQAENSYIKNVEVNNNTFVNTGGHGFSNPQGGSYDVIIQTQAEGALGHAENVKVNNNIFYHPYTIQNSDSVHGSSNGVTFNNNIWSKAPTHVSSTNNIFANALLKGKSGNGDFPVFTQKPAYDQLMDMVHWFELKNSSPAIDKALPVSYINLDKYGAKRPFGPAPDIGAHEFGGKPGPTNTPSPTQAISQWDLNQDNNINILDFSYLLFDFASEYSFPDLPPFSSSLL